MSYQDYLASRGYQRVTFQPTQKRPGDRDLVDACKPAIIVPTEGALSSQEREA